MQRDIVHMILYDQNHHILMQLRDEKAPSYPCTWSFFGGGIKAGETPEEALGRELYEEIRFVPQQPKPFIEETFDDNPDYDMQGTKYYFIEECLDKSGLELHEGEAMQWFSFHELGSLNLLSCLLTVIKRIKLFLS